MTLPAPNLDDRRFQDLVDEAKRMVQNRCPEWTDHNVSDPGVTLIETFAFLVDQLIYRVNRVPDRMYLKFLDLLGVRPFPPAAASTDVTFWLTAPQAAEVSIPKGTSVSTTRTATEEAIVFSVTADLVIPPVELVRLASSVGQPPVSKDHTSGFEVGAGFDAFGTDPLPGDALYVGLSRPAPSCALLLRFDCEVRGLGIDPRNPPVVWEVFDGSRWLACRVQKDETGGLNRAGDILLHLPPVQVLSAVGSFTAAWLRCRLVASEPGQAEYSASPRVRKLTVATMGGTTRATNADFVVNEVLGSSEGVPGQRFRLRRPPVVPGDEPEILEVAGKEGWEQWTRVTSFAASGPEDRHFLLDSDSGEVMLGPAVREADGSLRRYGAVPPAGAAVRMPQYRTGGGRQGNVAPGAINVLKSSIPYIARVENRNLAGGGVEAESIEAVKVRGPLTLRTRDRAVTREDYEYLVKEVAPEVARVRCIPSEAGSGSVRVLVLPAVDTGDPASLNPAQLVPPAETLQRIRDYLEQRRIIGVRVNIEPPKYKGLTVVAKVHCGYRSSPEAVKAAATAALHRYLHPVVGGLDGEGWVFGRPVSVAEIQAVLDEVPGTDIVDEVLLFQANLSTGARGERSTSRLAIAEDELPLSYGHQVFVERR